MNALDISSVTFRYDGSSAPALRDFSMAVADGQMHALLGPNGAGKSTLMRIITGQLRGQSGGVSVYGLPMPDAKALSLIGCAPQPISLYPSLTARENLRFFGAMAGMSKEQIALRSEWALEKTGLADYSEAAVATFSGGMLRRLNLAAALLHSPKLLLLDEPSAGVDPQSRNNLYETLAELNGQGVTVLLCTHMMEEAQRLCSGLTLLDRGERIYDGRMSDIDNLEEFFLKKTGRGLRDP
ncbi:MAG TPA: ABC transporter ATP-binding protein [Smithellaceae bacterium]|nr:ABC transporter ATP-binding protein [Smithellaceae bacterium]HRS83486.1 ABC transporter ATP-binding protein [Smithellaceae bacterium]HRV45283.1 ABC transporter ATP-binding protein [Smithellaceae bacterium]